jgi:hypothetical protein
MLLGTWNELEKTHFEGQIMGLSWRCSDPATIYDAFYDKRNKYLT